MLYDIQRDNLDDRQKGVIGDARACVRSANKMIEEVLSLSAGDLPTVPIHFEDVNLNMVLNTLSREFRDPIMQSGGSLSVIPNTLSIYTDPQILMRILRNFLTNTVKYAAGSKVVIGARKKQDSFTIHVIDSGLGIAEKDMAHLFKDFYRGDAGPHNDPGGFGLGLSIAKQLAQRCNGDIKIKSRPNHGTCCTLILPANIEYIATVN